MIPKNQMCYYEPETAPKRISNVGSLVVMTTVKRLALGKGNMVAYSLLQI